MFMSPVLMLVLAHEKERSLIAEADRARLLNSSRQARKARRAERKVASGRGRPTTTLASCEPSAVVPLR
jgi:hypothetical protein